MIFFILFILENCTFGFANYKIREYKYMRGKKHVRLFSKTRT